MIASASSNSIIIETTTFESQLWKKYISLFVIQSNVGMYVFQKE